MLLQHAQNFGLNRRAHIADFVEEQAAAVGLLESADALPIGAGEGALLVTEELGLEQGLRQRGAVHLDEVARGAQRVVMDRAGDQLLAGSRLAANQHGRVALGHLADDTKHALQWPAGADDAIEIVNIVLRVSQVIELVAHPPHLERLLDLHFHLFDLERLLHVVERADLHRFNGCVHRTERRHQDDRGRGVQGLGRPKHIEAVAATHLEVAQHEIEMAFVQTLDCLVSVGGLFHFMAGSRQGPGKSASKGIVIICDENATHSSSSFSLVVR